MANRQPPGDRMSFGKNAAKDVDAYWEYTRLGICFLTKILIKLQFCLNKVSN